MRGAFPTGTGTGGGHQPPRWNPPRPEELQPHFPQLEITGLIGAGGMGAVYRAVQKKLDRTVALKILPLETARDPAFAERFAREAKALALLNHPNIVTVYDFGQSGAYFFFIMEFVEGANLRQLIQSKTLEARQALELVMQICAALQFAHDEQVVHRDIKPENILISKKGQVKIADFGLAKLMGPAPDSGLTASQMVMGTVNYMAPEQRENSRDVDHRADIYSLGVVFYEMLTGQVPMGRFDPPSKKVRVDVRLDEVVLHALEQEPSRRYQQVSEVRSNVETISQSLPAQPAAGAPADRPVSSPRFLSFVALPGLLLALVLMVWALWNRSAPALLGLPLAVTLPSLWFYWRYETAADGLRWRDLPPAVRRRGNWRAAGWIAICIPAIFLVLSIIPIRIQEWRETWYTPADQTWGKVGFAGTFTRYAVPVSGEYEAAPHDWELTLKVSQPGADPAAMTVTLPGLRARFDNEQHVLDLDTLTHWLQTHAKVDATSPAGLSKARQIMALFKSYENRAPATWEEFFAVTRADLPDFGFNNFTLQGNFGWGFYFLISFLLAGLFAYYWVMLRSLRNTFAAGRAEIAAGRWTPPQRKLSRFPLALKVLFTVSLIPLGLAVYQGTHGDPRGMLLLVFTTGTLLGGAVSLHSRQEIQRARDAGLWPSLGEMPTPDHVRRLAQAGEMILAIKLYRQIHPVSLRDAKAIVEKMK